LRDTNDVEVILSTSNDVEVILSTSIVRHATQGIHVTCINIFSGTMILVMCINMFSGTRLFSDTRAQAIQVTFIKMCNDARHVYQYI